MAKGICIAGIDTEVGKTLVSLLVCNALKMDYWKPVQTGYPKDSDRIFVEENSLFEVKTFPETYCYKEPVSPHQAAIKEGPEIDIEQINLPQSDNAILVETAGGIMSPLSYKATNLDMMEKLGLPVILVVKNYLGSINHTLMSIKLLKEKCNLMGLIISGDQQSFSEEAYTKIGDCKILAHIPQLDKIDEANVKEQTDKLAKYIKL